MKFSDLNINGVYTYADYLTWTFNERVELIKGKLFNMSPAPNLNHQKVSREFSYHFVDFMKGHPCQAFTAPFDVRLTKRDNSTDKQITTVVQPDICVVYDEGKLDQKGCLGAPDLVLEILSTHTTKRDLTVKYKLYEENAVKEYWVASPDAKTLIIYTLNDKGKYESSRLFTMGDVVVSKVLKGFKLQLDDVFNF